MCCDTIALYRTVLALYAVSGIGVAIFLTAAAMRVMFADAKVASLRRENPETTNAITAALAVAFATVLAAGWPMSLACWALLRFVVIPKILADTHRRHTGEK